MKLVDIYARLSPFLRPLGIPYSFFMKQRRNLYRQGLLPSYQPSCPIVSVGNISWGGTGKTPVTAWLLQWAEERDLKAVVLMRGYRARAGKRPLLVRRDSPVEQAGDEALLLARAFPNAAVVVFPKRSEGARFALNYLAPDLIILDDGMQHLAMGRDLDLVLLRPEDFTREWDRVIPSGTWREGRSALASASAFGIKAGAEEFERLRPAARERLAAFGKPLFSFTLVPIGLRPVFPRQGRNNPLLSADRYGGRPYILVSGVGNAARVEATAQQFMGQAPVAHFDFDDHHQYTEADVQALLKMSPVPLPVLCTAKDAVKLRCFSDVWGNTPLWTLETRVEFGPCLDFASPGGEALPFPAWWEAWWKRRAAPSGGGGPS